MVKSTWTVQCIIYTYLADANTNDTKSQSISANRQLTAVFKPAYNALLYKGPGPIWQPNYSMSVSVQSKL